MTLLSPLALQDRATLSSLTTAATGEEKNEEEEEGEVGEGDGVSSSSSFRRFWVGGKGEHCLIIMEYIVEDKRGDRGKPSHCTTHTYACKNMCTNI